MSHYPRLTMARIAFLSCPITLPGHPQRREDAFEHDQQFAAIAEPLSEAGFELVAISWDADVDWSGFSCAVIGTTWDYWDRCDAYLETLTKIEQMTPLLNPSALVRWNIRKTYLRELESKGVATIPTHWIERPSEKDILSSFDAFDTDGLVIKRQIGAGADGQHRIKRGEQIPALKHPMMVQPFMSSIQTEGEYSFIFIDGHFSHALLKQAKAGDYRIQSLYGGRETPVSPTTADLKAARSVVETLDEMPLYGRIDMVRGEEGQLLLMEFELIEPYLYPEQGPRLGQLYVDALKRRID